jgi:GTPase SAR1 family protein
MIENDEEKKKIVEMADGIVLTFNISTEESLENIKKILKGIFKIKGLKFKTILLVGTHSDQPKKINQSDIADLNLKYIETSYVENKNIGNGLFLELLHLINENRYKDIMIGLNNNDGLLKIDIRNSVPFFNKEFFSTLKKNKSLYSIDISENNLGFFFFNTKVNL